ncbi:MAG: hypothetical protein LBJ96_00890 [Holosporaceae bacterium]|jgi:hypothetical protein|nr:hypothetical protein [Holosporaceae bacterium]
MTINNNLKKIALALLWGGGLINAEAGFSVEFPPCTQKFIRHTSIKRALPPLLSQTKEDFHPLSISALMYGIDGRIGFSSKKMRDFPILNSDGMLSDEFKNLDKDETVNDLSCYLEQIPYFDVSVNQTTRWFVRKFFEGEKPIIFFDSKHENHFSMTFTKMFMLSFLKIADNHVGRNLLHSILSLMEWTKNAERLLVCEWQASGNDMKFSDLKSWPNFLLELPNCSGSQEEINLSGHLKLLPECHIEESVIPYEIVVFYNFIKWFKKLEALCKPGISLFDPDKNKELCEKILEKDKSLFFKIDLKNILIK